jgi:hypothetical protein
VCVFYSACESWSQRSERERDQLHGASWSSGMSQTTVGGAQGLAECLGEGDVARVIGSDAGSEPERSLRQPKRGGPGKRDASQVLDGLLESLVTEAPNDFRCGGTPW